MWLALAALYAVVGLPLAGNGTLQRDKVLAAVLPIFRRAGIGGQRPLVLTFIIMYEDGGNVDAVGAWHAVFAVVAGNVLQSDDAFRHVVVEEALLLFGKRHQRTVTEQIVLQMFHEGHAAEHCQHALWRTGIAERPRCNAALRGMAFQLCGKILWKIGQPAAK